MKTMKAVGIMLALSVTVWASALVEDRPPGAQFQPETSQAELTEMQQGQVVQGEVGMVPMKTDDAVQLEESTSDTDAEENVAAKDAAKSVVVAAAEDIKPKRSGPNYFFFGLLAAVLCGAYMGLRTWANKSLPTMLDTSGRKPR
jgi:hypothetical protein